MKTNLTRTLSFAEEHLIVLLLAITLGLALLGCKGSPSETEPYITEPTQYRNATFPLAIGNQWAYVDSTLGSDPSHAETNLTVTSITQYKEEGVFGWWQLQYAAPYNLSYELMIVNDSIYERSPLNGLPNPRLEYLPARSLQDTAVFHNTEVFSGIPMIVRVYPYAGTFATPAGNFDSVFVYDIRNDDPNYSNDTLNYKFGWKKLLTYFRPHTGILGSDYFLSTGPDATYRLQEKSRLVYYSIIK